MSGQDSTNGGGPPGNEPLRFISIKEVSRRVGYTPQHIRRLIAAGEFPPFVHLGENKIGFVEAEITAWQRARIAERDAKRGKGGDGAQVPPPGP
jgi:prophage regulatory protein